jgi:hypothetical protein
MKIISRSRGKGGAREKRRCARKKAFHLLSFRVRAVLRDQETPVEEAGTLAKLFSDVSVLILQY